MSQEKLVSLKEFSSVYAGNVSVGQDLSHIPDFLKKQFVQAGFAHYVKAKKSGTYKTKVVEEKPEVFIPGTEQPEPKSSSSSPAGQVFTSAMLNRSENGDSKKASKKKGK